MLDDFDALASEADDPLGFEAATIGAFGLAGALPPAGADLLGGVRAPPDIRARLHTICALYAHAASAEQRLKLLDGLEAMALETAAMMADELLDAGWRPREASTRDPPLAPPGFRFLPSWRR